GLLRRHGLPLPADPDRPVHRRVLGQPDGRVDGSRDRAARRQQADPPGQRVHRRARAHLGPGRPAGNRRAPRPGAAAATAATARRDRPGAVGWLAYAVVLGLVAADLVWLWAGGAHAATGGTLALAGAMFVAAFARLTLPESWAGLLASRKRVT